MTKEARLPALDALRGIAALAVCVSHVTFFWAETSHVTGLHLKVLRAFMMWGHTAVILFFALSGFVLTLNHSHRRLPYTAFLAIRIFRIYPPYLVVLGLVTLAIIALQPVVLPWMTSFVRDTMPEMSVGGFADAAALVTTSDSHASFNVVTWSLVHEMRFSIAFPLMAACLLRSRRAFLAISLGVYILTLWLIPQAGLSPFYMLSDNIWASVLITIHYLPCFALGMWAAHAYLTRDNLAMPIAVQALGIVFTLLVPRYVHDDLLISAWATALIMIAAYPSRFASFLKIRPLTFLGRISYSLYLIHFPLVWFLFFILMGHLPVFVIALISLAGSLAAGTALHFTVEGPCAQAGKAWLKRRAPKGEGFTLTA